MDVVRDLLDKLVLDRNGREMGRVDGIVLDWRPNGAPRLAAILIGPSVLGFRLHRIIGRSVAAIELALGIDRGRPVRIDFGDVTEIGDDIKVDLAVTDTSTGTLEQRLRAWLIKIPGAR